MLSTIIFILDTVKTSVAVIAAYSYRTVNAQKQKISRKLLTKIGQDAYSKAQTGLTACVYRVIAAKDFDEYIREHECQH